MGELLKFLVHRKDKPDSSGIQLDRKAWTFLVIPATGLPVSFLFLNYGNPYSFIFYLFSMIFFITASISLAVFPPLKKTGYGVLISGVVLLVLSFVHEPFMVKESITRNYVHLFGACVFVLLGLFFLLLRRLQILPFVLSLMIMLTISVFMFVDHDIALYIPLIAGLLTMAAIVGFHNKSIGILVGAILVPSMYLFLNLFGPLPFYDRVGHVAIGSIPCVLYIFAYHYLVGLFRGNSVPDSPWLDTVIESRLRRLGLDKNSIRLLFVILAGIGSVINYTVQIMSWHYLSIALLLTVFMMVLLIAIFKKSSKVITVAFRPPSISELKKHRQFVRIESKDIITFSLGSDADLWNSGLSLDFTPWGMTISLSEKVREGDLININYVIPEKNQHIPLIGEVVWASCDNFSEGMDVTAGIRITRMDTVDGSFPLIEHYFAKLRTLSTWDEKILNKVDSSDYVAV